MKLKSTLAAALLAVSSAGAFAAPVSFAGELAKFFGKLTTPGLFTKTITFDSLASGTYDVQLSLSATNITFSSGSLDGHALNFTTVSPNFSFGEVAYKGSAPTTLTLSGTVLKKNAPFSGSITAISAVPEPETYAMLLAGLGLMGTIARRRAQKEVA